MGVAEDLAPGFGMDAQRPVADPGLRINEVDSERSDVYELELIVVKEVLDRQLNNAIVLFVLPIRVVNTHFLTLLVAKKQN